MGEELKPCPFCGGTDIRNVSSRHPGPSYHLHADDTIFAVNCGDCGASVPNRYRNDLVCETWNRRPAPSSSERVALTEERMDKIYNDWRDKGDDVSYGDLMRAVELAHGIRVAS